MKKLKALCLAVMVSSSFNVVAGIPVAVDADPTRDMQWMQDWTEKIKQWGETTIHYKNEIEAYKNQLAAATGVRDIAAFTNELRNLQSELTNIYKQGDAFVGDFTKNPKGILSSEAMSLFNKYGAFDMCKSGITEADNLCKAKVVTTAANIEQGTKINKQLAQTMSQIESLSSRIESARDIKESQDLANALQAQSLKMQAVKMQYDVWVNKNTADGAMIKEQQRAAFKQQQSNSAVPTFN